MPLKKTTKKVRTIEETYQMKSPREHILIRPDSYVGSLEPQEELMWIYDEEHDIFIEKLIVYSPALYKIIDEVLVNAADHKANYPDLVTHFDIDIDVENGSISVKNDGPGIIVEKHIEHDMYIPTMIFGHLLTGSNFDDECERVTGGRNGYGSKLANIYSYQFDVETVDGVNCKKFSQRWTDNMANAEKPKITSLKSSNPKTYTKVTVHPDFPRFKVSGITPDMYSLFMKRAIDMAGVCDVTVSINGGKKIKFKSFKEYIAKYKFTAIDEGNTDITTEFSAIQYFETERWQVGVVYAPDQSFKHVSFVNGICTYHGGKHVDHVTDKIIDSVKTAIIKKQKKMTIKPQTIKDHLIVFVKSVIVNPAFTSQVKENLKTPVNKFGSKCEFPDKFIKSIVKLGIVDHVIENIQHKDQNKITKGSTKGSKSMSSILKLVDAPKAGTAESQKCSLILTEGDSAKALAIAGLSVVGRDYYGVFPLKGKPLNARENSPAVLAKNEEICNIVKTLGLQMGKRYTSTKDLRYGHLIIMSDQDYDGLHIKGLVINFIHNFWPELLDIDDFMSEFITPVIKCVKGKEVLWFYSVNDYNIWKETCVGNWRIKYYKGLGTSTQHEAKEYFSKLDDLLKTYYSVPSDTTDSDRIADKKTFEDAKKIKKPKKVIKDDDDEDETYDGSLVIPTKYKNVTTEAITLAFEKDRADDRKIWVKSEGNYDIDHNAKKKTYSDFFNKEMVLFSKDDCERSIASIDGLKISQRKILYTILKRKVFSENKELRVAQLAGFISADTKYHHGENSLVGAIKKMGANFTGSNNLNLIFPSGQYGTRNLNGADAASERYIHAYLEPIAQLLIKDIDNDVLEYINDDGTLVEPKIFAPILPLILINGSSGIGTGFGSDVTKYNPKDIINITKAKINGEEPNYDIKPYFKGFTGSILKSNEPGKFLIYGKYQLVNETTVRITELPLGSKSSKCPEDYKAFLDKMQKEKKIESFEDNLVNDPPIFYVTIDEKKLDGLRQKKEVYKFFNLVTTISTGNMNLYDYHGNLKHYDHISGIVDDFYKMRYDIYDKRKTFLTNKFENEADILRWKMKFINDVISEKIVIFKQKKDSIIAKLVEFGYPKIAKIKSIVDAVRNEDEEENNDATYNYLTDLKLFMFTEEKIAELQQQLDKKEEELDNIKTTSIEDQWLKEIDEFETEYDIWVEKKPEAIAVKEKKTAKKITKKTKKVVKNTK